MVERVDDLYGINKYTFSQSPGNYDIRGKMKRPKILNSDEIEKICEYLENPTKNGIWSLKGKWLINEGFSEYIHSELIKEFKDKDEIQIQSGKSEVIITLNEEDKEEILNRVNLLTLIFNIFSYIYYLENKPLKSSYFYHLDKTICDIIDIQKLKEEYIDAYEYFKTEIFFEGFEPDVFQDNITRIKDGFFILTNSAKKTGTLSVVSMYPSNLEKMNVFLTKLGKISESRIIPVYSPEETVFIPYFSLLGEAHPYFIEQESTKRLFSKSINEYNEENYSYCVSTIGLIAEDYLIQIYETFFRDVCPKRLTMGQMYDLIHNKLKQDIPIKSTPLPEINILYSKIEELLNENRDEIDDGEYSTKIIQLIRDVTIFVQNDKKHTKSLIEMQEKKKENISIFPTILIENIKELIRNRNATSHNSRIPIGNYEALRTVYCCITLIMWWINEKKSINWEDDTKSILKKSIERNTGNILN